MEMNPNSVICAINVNDYDQDVVDLAATMAVHFKTPLHLLHVTLFPNTANISVYSYVGETSVFGREQKRLDSIGTEIVDVEIQRHHLQGIPSETVLAFVKKWEPRLLVLGTHGRKGLKRIFGSVSSEILRNAECPVMVLKQDENNQNFVGVESESTESGYEQATPDTAVTND